MKNTEQQSLLSVSIRFFSLLPTDFGIGHRAWLKASFLLLAALAFVSACHKKSGSQGVATIDTLPADLPNPINGDARPAITLKLPDLLRTNKPAIIKSQGTGATAYEWSQQKGPGFLQFETAQAAETRVSADQDGVYTVRLTARNDDGVSVFRDMSLVWDSTAPSLMLSDEVRTFQPIVLDAQVGSDAESISWSQVAGPGTVSFENKTARSTRVSADKDGTYTLRVTAADDLGNQSTKDLQLIWDTALPTVSVGQDRYANQQIMLDAMSVDAVSFSWSKIAGPGLISFGSPNAEDTTVKASMDGSYVLRLTITKASGATASDDLNLIWDTTPPSVSLGVDRSIRYRATVDAATSGAMNFVWSQISGPGLAYFSAANSEDSSIATNMAGDYEFELKASDAAGNSATDRILIHFDNDLRVQAKQISGGGSSSCAVLDDDSLSCWGYNYEGELGYGDNRDRYMPPSFGLNLGDGKTAVSVAASYAHSCAILNDRSVKCWGQNTSGELGLGDSMAHVTPPASSINLGSGRTAKAIATGFAHSCALLDDGSVKCWGANASGQLGYGDYLKRLAPPTAVVNLGSGRSALAISAGAYHSCALLDNNSMKCWGSNSDGQLGYGDNITRPAPSIAPLAFPGSLSVLSMTSGHYHSCAVLGDKSLRCWGRNAQGQLGYGDLASRLAPSTAAVDFGSGTTVNSVTAGLSHSCALLSNGSVQCWGNNDEGQLGFADNNPRSAPSAAPLSVGANRVALSVAAGRLHTCALLDDRTLKCWGNNSYGQLGNGNTVNQNAVPSKAIEYGNKASALVMGP